MSSPAAYDRLVLKKLGAPAKPGTKRKALRKAVNRELISRGGRKAAVRGRWASGSQTYLNHILLGSLPNVSRGGQTDPPAGRAR